MSHHILWMAIQQFKIMAISTSITVQEALDGLNSQTFPPDLLKEGDLVWFPGGEIGTDIGHRFKWAGTEWVSDPADLPTVGVGTS